jgi:hypothetical protein
MGCFDYNCECDGTKCVFTGGQDGGSAEVIIEVPLNDGTTVYVKGSYDSYGAVHVGNYRFYPEQFEDFVDHWLRSEPESERCKIFLAKRIWTVSYLHYEYDEDEDDDSFTKKKTNCFPKKSSAITTLEESTLGKCIRADGGLNILSDNEKKQQRVADLKKQIESAQKELQTLAV